MRNKYGILILFLMLISLTIIPATAAYNESSLHYNPMWNDKEQYIEISGTSFAYNADEYGQIITGVSFYIDPDETVNFDLTQSGGCNIPGYVQYLSALNPLINITDGLSFGTTESQFNMKIGTTTKNVSQFAAFGYRIGGEFYLKPVAESSGHPGLGQDTGHYGLLIRSPSLEHDTAYQQVDTILNYPLIRISGNSNEEVKIRIYYTDSDQYVESVQEYMQKNPNSINFSFTGLWNFISSSIDVIYLIIQIFTFIFIDHFFAVVALFESVMIAYSAAQSRDIITFAKKVIQANKSFFEFIFGVFAAIVNLICKLITAISPL